MEQGLKEFIEETRRIIPSHFGRIITPLLSNVDNPEPNPLYYQENIFGFKKTLEERIVKTGLVMAIVGSALLPKLQGLIIDIGGSGVKDKLILGVPEVNISFVLPLACFFYIACFGFGVFKSKFN